MVCNYCDVYLKSKDRCGYFEFEKFPVVLTKEEINIIKKMLLKHEIKKIKPESCPCQDTSNI